MLEQLPGETDLELDSIFVPTVFVPAKKALVMLNAGAISVVFDWN